MEKEKLLSFIRSEQEEDKEILKQISQHPEIKVIFEELVATRKRELIIEFCTHQSIQMVESQPLQNQSQSCFSITINQGEWKLALFNIFKELQKVYEPFKKPPDLLNSSPLLLEKVELQDKFYELISLNPPNFISPESEVYMW